MIRSVLVFAMLVLIRWVTMVFYRLRGERRGSDPKTDWSRLRIMAFLNHTSLYEPLFAAFAPYPLLWRFARHGVLPVAEKTIRRRIGLFFRFLARKVVVITRQRDRTWDEVMNRIDREALVMILPEGRMMRRGGLDATGREMTIRGGIADILAVLDEGQVLLVYSGGLHHVQAPGERLPRLFRTIRARFELLRVADYRLAVTGSSGVGEFRDAVIRDLTARRDRLCPVQEADGIRGGEVPRWRGWPDS